MNVFDFGDYLAKPSAPSAAASSAAASSSPPLLRPPPANMTRVLTTEHPAVRHGYHPHELVRYEVPLSAKFFCDLCKQSCGCDAKGSGPSVDAATLETFDAEERQDAASQFKVIYLCEREQCCKGVTYLFGLCARCVYRDQGGLKLRPEFGFTMPPSHQPDHVLYASYEDEQQHPHFKCSNCPKMGQPHRTFFFTCYQDPACLGFHLCSSCYRKKADFGLRERSILKPAELNSPPGSRAKIEAAVTQPEMSIIHDAMNGYDSDSLENFHDSEEDEEDTEDEKMDGGAAAAKAQTAAAKAAKVASAVAEAEKAAAVSKEIVPSPAEASFWRDHRGRMTWLHLKHIRDCKDLRRFPHAHAVVDSSTPPRIVKLELGASLGAFAENGAHASFEVATMSLLIQPDYDWKSPLTWNPKAKGSRLPGEHASSSLMCTWMDIVEFKQFPRALYLDLLSRLQQDGTSAPVIRQIREFAAVRCSAHVNQVQTWLERVEEIKDTWRQPGMGPLVEALTLTRPPLTNADWKRLHAAFPFTPNTPPPPFIYRRSPRCPPLLHTTAFPTSASASNASSSNGDN